jgi:hypothetical protein
MVALTRIYFVTVITTTALQAGSGRRPDVHDPRPNEGLFERKSPQSFALRSIVGLPHRRPPRITFPAPEPGSEIDDPIIRLESTLGEPIRSYTDRSSRMAAPRSEMGRKTGRRSNRAPPEPNCKDRADRLGCKDMVLFAAARRIAPGRWQQPSLRRELPRPQGYISSGSSLLLLEPAERARQMFTTDDRIKACWNENRRSPSQRASRVSTTPALFPRRESRRF